MVAVTGVEVSLADYVRRTTSPGEKLYKQWKGKNINADRLVWGNPLTSPTI
ncbi:hypothetical protein W02_16690 [Nitrospira sp. KM1]|nr:hypothetical protein W02_16690 [Nitrospira sp. KM1]